MRRCRVTRRPHSALRRMHPPNAGEEAPPGATRSQLLRRLAARRIAERARIVALPLRYTTSGARRGSRRYLTLPVDVGSIGG